MSFETIIAILTGLVTTASIIVKITPSKVDNLWAYKALKILEILAMNNVPVEKK